MKPTFTNYTIIWHDGFLEIFSVLACHHLTRDSSNFAAQLSARGSRGVGPQAVTYEVDVSEPPPGLDQPLDDEPGLGGHHSGVGDGLVVVGGRSSRPPRHDDHVVVSLSTKYLTHI